MVPGQAVSKIKPKYTPNTWRVYFNPMISHPNSIRNNSNHLTKQEKKIRFFTPLEVAHEIDNNINPKKAPGFDEISPRILKELPKKTIILLTLIYNTILRLESFPMQWKKVQVIMLLKPGKPPERATSYRPISLLPRMSKLFERLLLKRLKPLIEERYLIPDLQFGFKNKHSTIDQVHRVTSVISKAFEGNNTAAECF